MQVRKTRHQHNFIYFLFFSTQIHKADFHGAKVKVVRSKCPSLVGIKGIVILDTKNTFKVIGKDDILRSEYIDFYLLN